MTDKTEIERRAFLSTVAAASAAALSSVIPWRHAAAQPNGRSTSADSDDFETAEIETGDNSIFARRYGKESPVLMVHGFPRTSLMWRSWRRTSRATIP